MLTPSLLLVPFPPSKSPVPSLPQIGSLAASTRSTPPSSFPEYLQALQSLPPNSHLPSRWSHPFGPSITADSTQVEAEICGTIWNFLGFLHTQIREIEVGDKERLKEIRRLIANCVACAENFALISSKFEHKFWTQALALFTTNYTRYIASVWGLSCGSITQQNDPASIAAWSVPCLETIRECEVAVGKLEVTFRTGLGSIIAGLKAYFIAFQSLRRGEAALEDDKGLALASYRAAAAAFDGLTINHPDTFFRTAIEHVKRLAVTARDDLERRHKSIHFQRVPKDLPKLEGAKVPIIPANNDLLFIPREGGGGGQLALPPPPAKAGSGPPPRFTAESPPQFGGGGGPPRFTAEGPPQFGGGGSPPLFAGGGPPQRQPKPGAPAGGFPEWERVKALKENVRAQLDRLVQHPEAKINGPAALFLSPAQAASDSDRLIEEHIAAFGRGASDFSREHVLQEIQGSLAFYTNLQARLNQLENQR